ncbi:MAG: ABC transporter permease [Bacteroidaceae bacterium]|nr:ABC transporter permease [Bacteroidaceae bacterium]
MKRELLAHYFSLAFRNMRKFRSQSIFFVISLSVSFAFVVFSTLWLRYENTYDTFHADAKKLYMMRPNDIQVLYEMLGTKIGVSPLATLGRFVQESESMPEVEASTLTSFADATVLINGAKKKARYLQTDTCFQGIFPLRLVQGSLSFLSQADRDAIALSESSAREWFGQTDPIGQKVSFFSTRSNFERTVVAVFADMPKHSVLAADMITVQQRPQMNMAGNYVFKLVSGRGVFDSFSYKAAHYSEEGIEDNMSMAPMPLSKAHRLGFNSKSPLSYNHIRAFFLISLILFISALANLLSFFLNRIRYRRQEMTLRKMCGARGRDLTAMFSWEVLVMLLTSAGAGFFVVWALYERFEIYANISEKAYVLSNTVWVLLAVVAVSFVLCVIAVSIMRKKALSLTAKGTYTSNRKYNAVNSGVLISISVFLIFCAMVNLKQLRYLRTTDWGIAYKNTALLTVKGLDPQSVKMDYYYQLTAAIRDADLPRELEAIPGVEEVQTEGEFFLQGYQANLPQKIRRTEADEWKDCVWGWVPDPSSSVCGFTTLEGELPNKENWVDGQIVITESVRDLLGMKQAVGQTMKIQLNDGEHTVTVASVIKDIRWENANFDGNNHYVLTPRPAYIRSATTNVIAFSFVETQRDDIVNQVSAMMERHPEMVWELEFGEDLLAEMMASEDNLSRLLNMITVACILIAVFSIYNIVTLTCRQRRKEIAIRKVHGAKVKDILYMLVKEYGRIYVVSSFITFIIGYVVMHLWLEQYVNRTTIGICLYLFIFVGLLLLIGSTICVRIMKAAYERPADVIKSE